jgi:hypothetical protein
LNVWHSLYIIATEAMNHDALVAQANAAIATRDERQVALFAPHLVPRDRNLRTHGDLPGELDISPATRDIAIDHRDPGKRHQDRYASLRDPSNFLVADTSLCHYITSNRLESVLRSNSFPSHLTTGQGNRDVGEVVRTPRILSQLLGGMSKAFNLNICSYA